MRLAIVGTLEGVQSVADACAGKPYKEYGLELIVGDITKQDEYETIATAGNSFGLMDGGVDMAIRDTFPGIEIAVQNEIKRKYLGELNVGVACLVPMPDQYTRKPNALIYAPTMRVPCPIADTQNVYLAMWATLVTAVHHGVESLAVPMFGTGAGQMPFYEAARQMLTAWRNYLDSPPRYVTWEMATARHHQIVNGRCTGCKQHTGGVS